MQVSVLGATGAIGKDLVQELIAHPQITAIHLFVRRPIDAPSEKVHIHVVDFERPESWATEVRGDVAFSCLGTTRQAAGSKDAQYRVDVTYQLDFARAAAEQGVPAFVLVSAVGANARSPFFYTRIKGELEEAVQALPFRQLAIVRPPSLIRKGNDRLGERITVPLLQALASIGLLRSMRPMPTDVVAQRMLQIALDGHTGIFSPEALWQGSPQGT